MFVRFCLAALLCQLFTFVAPSARAEEAVTPTMAPAVIFHYRATVTATGKEAKTHTMTVSAMPQGVRMETSDGLVILAQTGQGTVYVLNAKTREAKAGVLSTINPFTSILDNLLSSGKNPPEITYGTQAGQGKLLGFPCVTKPITLRYEEEPQFVGTGEMLTGSVAGYPLLFSISLQVDSRAILRFAPTKVEILSESPTHLLEVPKGYKIVVGK